MDVETLLRGNSPDGKLVPKRAELANLLMQDSVSKHTAANMAFLMAILERELSGAQEMRALDTLIGLLQQIIKE